MVLRVAPLLAGYVAGAVAIALAPDKASRDFYVVCATVIPVLLLTLGVELRLLRLRGPMRLPAELGEAQSKAGRLEERVPQLAARLKALPDDTPDVAEARADMASAEADLERVTTALGQISRKVGTWAYRWGAVGAAYALLSAVGLFVGEMKALTVIADESYRQANPALPFAAVVLGFAAITVAVAVLPPAEETPS